MQSVPRLKTLKLQLNNERPYMSTPYIKMVSQTLWGTQGTGYNNKDKEMIRCSGAADRQ